jgi:hypothetical protein
MKLMVRTMRNPIDICGNMDDWNELAAQRMIPLMVHPPYLRVFLLGHGVDIPVINNLWNFALLYQFLDEPD